MSRDSKQQFLDTYDHEHAITLRVLRAYPADQLDLRPHAKLKTARELAWVFALERGLGTKIWQDVFAKGMPSGAPAPPTPPDDWDQLIEGIEQAHREFRELVMATTDEDFHGQVHFFTAPKTIGAMTRKDVAWFLLHDEIHHRGQFSVYLRMSGAKVPSIYGPSGDEQWI
jgi:uncharacterized damage-inducible protein DinB